MQLSLEEKDLVCQILRDHLVDLEDKLYTQADISWLKKHKVLIEDIIRKICND